MELVRQVLQRLRGCLSRVRAGWWSLLLKPKGKIFVNGRIAIPFIEHVHLGSRVSLNEGVSIFGKGEVWIGDDVHLSPFVIINTGGLDLTVFRKQRTHVYKPVFIEDGVWVGSNALINPGVRLGRGCVVGAGAVVTKDIPPFAVAAGVPARVMRILDDSLDATDNA